MTTSLMRSQPLQFARALVIHDPLVAGQVFVLVVAVGLTESIGLLLLVPLLDLVGLEAGGGSVGRIAESISAVFYTIGLSPTLMPVLLVYVLLIAARALLERWEVIALDSLGLRFVHELRARLYKAASAVPWVHFVHRRDSDIIHVLTNELERVSLATTQAVRLVGGAVLGLVYLGMAFFVSPPLTLIVGAAGILLLTIIRRWTSRARLLGELLGDLMREMHAAVITQLRGMKTIRSYSRVKGGVDDFERVSKQVAQTWAESNRDHATVTAFLEVGSATILAIVVYVSVSALNLSPAGILLLIFLFARFVPRFVSVQTEYRFLVHALPSYSRVMRLIEWCESRCEADRSWGGERGVELEESIELKGVGFRYPGNSEPIVSNLNLSIPARTTVAIAGPSGSGKTTVADLLIGLIQPDTGSIRVDGKTIESERLDSWRAKVGYVPQETFLLHDTIRANLLWARSDASEDELWTALRSAGAEPLVRLLREGLDTVIGDQGVLLSGGERQRIALARALLRKPSFLILDEATSALDYESESQVLEAVSGLKGQMTILLITHRLLSVRNAHAIHVMERGELIESGTWDELMRRPLGRFRQLETAQRERSAAMVADV